MNRKTGKNTIMPLKAMKKAPKPVRLRAVAGLQFDRPA
jgi:hypothetical protein